MTWWVRLKQLGKNGKGGNIKNEIEVVTLIFLIFVFYGESKFPKQVYNYLIAYYWLFKK